MPVKKMLIARYSFSNVFKIPDDIDLDDHGVKYVVIFNTLYVMLPNGKNVMIEAVFDITNQPCTAFEHPDKYEIKDNDPDIRCGAGSREYIPPKSAHAYCSSCFENLNAEPKRKLRIKK